MISVVVPVYNEHDVLRELYRRLIRVMEANGYLFEIVLVDDGSTDGSCDLEIELAQNDNRVKCVQLSRNFGHQIAITAGLDYAVGEVVIMMDADLQHPPELVPDMVAKWEEGYDLVLMVRTATTDATWFKRFTSAATYRVMGLLANVKVTAGAADFRLMDRKAVDSFRRIREQGRFMRGLVSWMGFRQTEIAYKADPRFAGESKYSLLKMIRLAFDGITTFSSTPLYFSALFGIVISMMGCLYIGHTLYKWMFTDDVLPGYTTLVAAIMLLGGIQLISLGLVGSYIGRIYDEVKNRPLYLVQRLYGPSMTSAEDVAGKRRAERVVTAYDSSIAKPTPAATEVVEK